MQLMAFLDNVLDNALCFKILDNGVFLRKRYEVVNHLLLKNIF